MATYFTPHPKTGWRYQRHIPNDLRPLLGGRKVSVKYIPAMSKREAESKARAYATQDDELWSRLRRLSASDAAQLARDGGLNARPSSGLVPLDLGIVDIGFAEYIQREKENISKIEPREVAEIVAKDDKAIFKFTAEEIALWKSDELIRMSKRLERNNILRKLSPEASEYSLDNLFRLWVKVKEPKITRKHESKMRLFKSVIGDVDYRTVTQTDTAKFRDHLATMGISKASQHNYLTVVRAMFSAAVSENKIPSNPASGVTVHGKRPNGKADDNRPFTGAEERLILEKAADTKFGWKRHDDAMWMLRLLAWTGARPREIAQLRKCDVYVESGVPLIQIREGHPLQSVKTSDRRKVPLHGAVADFVTYAKNANDDFVFGSFPHDKNGGRSAWIVNKFGKFLREKCGITDRKKTLYSFRHRFADATRNAEIPTEISKALMGHSTGDVHGKYGRGVDLKKLAEAVEKLNPLAD